MFFFCQDFAIEDVLNEYDVDKDGFITLTEFIGTVRNEGRAILSFFPPQLTLCNQPVVLNFCSSFGNQENPQHSGRLKNLYDFKICTTKIRTASWIETNSCAGLRLIAMVQQERK